MFYWEMIPGVSDVPLDMVPQDRGGLRDLICSSDSKLGGIWEVHHFGPR
jgi:hypothetical protein